MTNKISYLDDGDICILKKDSAEFYNSKGKKINKKILTMSETEDNYDKGDFKTFMQKEIFEQPNSIKSCINEYVDHLRDDINIYNFPWDITKIDSVVLIGCGTAYHACMIANIG
jgi:Glucosamine 6-phosphate synthetase, contains amidotransferase and phosphosugar isomerase domains